MTQAEKETEVKVKAIKAVNAVKAANAKATVLSPRLSSSTSDVFYAQLMMQARRGWQQQPLRSQDVALPPAKIARRVSSGRRSSRPRPCAPIAHSLSIVTPSPVGVIAHPPAGDSVDVGSLPRPPFRSRRTGARDPAARGGGQNPLEFLSRVSSHARPIRAAAAAPPSERNVSTPTAPSIPKGERPVGDEPARVGAPSQQPSSSDDDACYVGERDSLGRRHGRGVMKYPNGCRYVGCFSEGRRHGLGKCWYPEGLGVYTGGWRRNRKHGRGRMHYANGDVYEGDWEDDAPHGKGTLSVKESGQTYAGEFCRGKREGRGAYRWPNGDVYEGGWRGDARDGPGVLVRADGEAEGRVYYQGLLLEHGL